MRSRSGVSMSVGGCLSSKQNRFRRRIVSASRNQNARIGLVMDSGVDKSSFDVVVSFNRHLSVNYFFVSGPRHHCLATGCLHNEVSAAPQLTPLDRTLELKWWPRRVRRDTPRRE